MSSEKKSESLFPSWAICIVLSLVVGVVDRWMGEDIFRQWRTADYAETQGTVGTSFVTRDRNGRRMVYRLILGYNYTVDGQNYTSTQVGYGFSANSRGEAEEYEKRFALNSTVPVYYAPEDPSQAVLLRGLQGYSLLHLAWLYALHLILLGAWYSLRQDYRRRADGLGATVVEGRTYVPVSLGFDDWIMLCFGIFVACGVLYFVKSRPPLPLMGLFWVAILGATVSVVFRRRAQKKEGKFDFVLDERNGRLSVPAVDKATMGVDLPLSRLRGARFEKTIRVGHKNTQTTLWQVLLIQENGRGEWEESLVALLHSPEHAEHLSGWLNQTCARGPQQSPSPAAA